MKANRGLVLAVMLGGLDVAGCSVGENALAGKDNSGPHAAVIGNNPIDDCLKNDLSSAPSRIITLHIPTDIMSSLQVRKVNCVYSSPSGAKSCITSANAVPTKVGKDWDDGGAYDTVEEPPAATSDPDNWSTPLDMELNPSGESYWGSTSNQSIMIKIVLVTAGYKFFITKNNDFSYAVSQGSIGYDPANPMFTCLQAPVAQKVNGVWTQMIRLRVQNLAKATVPRKLGGLNIGILVPITGGKVYMPISLDPMVHNNG